MPQVIAAGEVALAVVASVFNPISRIQNNAMALVWSVAFALPILTAAAHAATVRTRATRDQGPCSSISYYDAILVGFWRA
jgi:hypothetical protein